MFVKAQGAVIFTSWMWQRGSCSIHNPRRHKPVTAVYLHDFGGVLGVSDFVVFFFHWRFETWKKPFKQNWYTTRTCCFFFNKIVLSLQTCPWFFIFRFYGSYTTHNVSSGNKTLTWTMKPGLMTSCIHGFWMLVKYRSFILYPLYPHTDSYITAR